MGDEVIAAHRERQVELLADSQTIMAAADAEKRDLNEEESKSLKANAAEFDHIKGLIELREHVNAQAQEMARPQARKAEAEPVRGNASRDDDEEDARPAARPQARTVPAQVRPAGEAGRGGFRAFGDFVAAVKTAASRGGTIDGRLMGAAASTYGNEAVGADGGFAVPPDYRATIMEKAFGEDSLMSRTDRQVTASNSMTFPTDMTTPWGSSGIQAYWEGEAAAITQSKPALKEVSVRLHKLAALVPVTEELLEDAPAMGGYVARKAAEKIDFKLSNAIAYGSGVGQPLGFMSSPVLVTVAGEGGQTADTINATNIVKMWGRMPQGSRSTAVWLIHPDAEQQLPLLTIGDSPVYVPPGGFSSAPYGSLLGRPVIPHQVCKTVGDLGDIMLVDLSSYLTVTKAGGMRAQTSMHLWFDQDLTAFKFTMRVAGQPWWSEATSALNGSFSQSPFITLAAR